MPYSSSSSSSSSCSTPYRNAHGYGGHDDHWRPAPYAASGQGSDVEELYTPQYVQPLPLVQHALPLRHIPVPSAPAQPLQAPIQMQPYVNFHPGQLPVYVVQVQAAPAASEASATVTGCVVGVMAASAICPVVTMIAAAAYFMS